MSEQNQSGFSHLDAEGKAAMVDVGGKSITKRTATAQSIVFLGEEIMKQLTEGDIQTKKGPVFQTAVIAGTMAVKRTHELIPLCHPLLIEKIKFDIQPIDSRSIEIWCTVAMTGKTGVEMEALTGASVAALTIYDMCKAMSLDIQIVMTRLMAKAGGKRDFDRGKTGR
ncbi:MAG: cyclic pyranopterin monophosphate synthase MoaC [Bacteroidota bacterium]